MAQGNLDAVGVVVTDLRRAVEFYRVRESLRPGFPPR
jgi:hypothetical protein